MLPQVRISSIQAYTINIFKNVGMAMPKTIPKLGEVMVVCRQDMLYKDYTSNPIPTSFYIPETILRVTL